MRQVHGETIILWLTLHVIVGTCARVCVSVFLCFCSTSHKGAGFRGTHAKQDGISIYKQDYLKWPLEARRKYSTPLAHLTAQLLHVIVTDRALTALVGVSVPAAGINRILLPAVDGASLKVKPPLRRRMRHSNTTSSSSSSSPPLGTKLA